MGACYSCSYCMETKCLDCGVPYDYYTNNEHRSRQSCRKSKNGYHKFPSRFILE